MARPRRDQSSRMLHVEDRRSLNLQFGAFTVLVFHSVVFLSLIHSCRGQSEVIVPSQPIVAVAGEDIILPCYLEPVMNAFDMTVEWLRPDLNHRFVLVWRDGVELESKKHPSFKGRTSVFTDELKHGNISLKLSTVKISDEGRYRCFTPEQDRYSDIQLVVGAVSSPVIQTIKNSSGVLECESNGWYPEPEVLWLDGEGHVLSAGPTETVRGPDDLYTVSSRVTVERRHGNSFTCRVQQEDINRTRETQIHVPDHFFMVPGPPGPPAAPDHPRVIIGSVIGCAALVTIAAIFVVWKWKQKKLKNKRKSLEDGGEETEEENRVTPRSDNTGFKVVMEGEGESAPLMAGREEENNVDNRREENMESQSEHLDHQNVAEGETHQDQLVPNERKAEEKKEQMNEKQGEKRDERENELPSVSKEVTEKPNIRIYEETTGRQNQELQAEKQEEETSQRNQEETKEQPEESTEGLKGREEENNVDNRGEEDMESQSEHLDHQNVAERETHQDQLVTKPETTRDMDRAGGQRDMRSINNEKVPLIPTEGQTHRQQDMIGRQVKPDRDQGEGEQTRKPVKEDSRLPMVPVTEEKEETWQEPMTDVDKDKAKSKKKRGKKKKKQQKGGVGATGLREQQQNQRERIQPEAERQREENDKKLKQQRGNSSQHLLEDRKQEGREAGREDETETEREGNQRDIRTDREAEEQKEKINEKVKETKTERELQSERQETIKRDKERTEVNTQEGDGNQHVLDGSKQVSEHEEKNGKDREANQSDIITTDRKAEEQIKEKLGGKRDERENELPSVSREVTEKPNIRIYQEITGRQNQELQAEKQEEETSQRNQEETKEQPEESTEGLKIEPEERREEELETDKGADSDETHKKSKETEEQLIEGQQQAEQPSGGEGEVRQQLQECFRFSAQRRAEINRRPQTQRKVKRGKKQQQKKEHHVDWSVRKRKLQEESSVQTEQTSKKLKEEQNDVQMNSGGEEEDVHMEPEVIDETQGQDVNLQLDQALMCQEDQEEPMES